MRLEMEYTSKNAQPEVGPTSGPSYRRNLGIQRQAYVNEAVPYSRLAHEKLPAVGSRQPTVPVDPQALADTDRIPRPLILAAKQDRRPTVRPFLGHNGGYFPVADGASEHGASLSLRLNKLQAFSARHFPQPIVAVEVQPRPAGAQRRPMGVRINSMMGASTTPASVTSTRSWLEAPSSQSTAQMP